MCSGRGCPSTVVTTTATGYVKYLLLADRASPYLLARVHWPDVAQAITIGSQDWLDLVRPDVCRHYVCRAGENQASFPRPRLPLVKVKRSGRRSS
jgi:hypothetical protein